MEVFWRVCVCVCACTGVYKLDFSEGVGVGD